MKSSRRWKSLAAIAGLYLAICGCGGGVPARVEAPTLDPEDAAKKAMEMYDTNKDGVISGDELKKVPGIVSAIGVYDTGGDKKVTAENIANRIRQWQESKVAVTSVMVNVTLDGRPLDGATIEFEPEPFLSPSIAKASGGVSAGIAAPAIDPKDPTKKGVNVGLYKVRISKQVNGKETLPARYNTETELGVEVAPGSPAMRSGMGPKFDLTSR